MLTQKQIDKIRSDIISQGETLMSYGQDELAALVIQNNDVQNYILETTDLLSDLLNMAETLLAVEQYVKTPTIPCCDDPTYDDGKETERLAVLDIISEYRERGNK